MKNIFLTLCLFIPMILSAQNKNLDALYEQASETSGLVIQYTQDVRDINYVYGVSANRWTVLANSPEQRDRLIRLNEDYLNQLKPLDFEQMSIHGQVDYVMLKRKVEENLRLLLKEKTQYAANEKYFPFSTIIYELEKQRRRGATMDGQKVAVQLNEAWKALEESKRSLEKIEKINQNDSRFSASVVDALKARLKRFYDFYNGYDPLFTWWVPEPYKKLDSALGEYAKLLASKSDAKPSDDGSGIGGQPVGREEINRLLKLDMIAYTPEELIRLADQEFAWCEAELLKASREMGFGDDWKAAQEQVKNSYVPAGTQPELIIKLYEDAQKFIEQHQLIKVPELSHETWGMEMMTPERQLVNPFFLGGRDIIISYPTNTMKHEDKMMSMRGNNPYFSRGTVQHELVPGHHLQEFMNSRYKSYRTQPFNTPFWTEGWTLYWELLLYKEGFAQTPEERIGMLFWRMHRCARITFSLKYQLGEWTPQQCVDYLVDRVGHEYANAHAEVKRSFEENYGPLYQLAYLVGGLQIMGLHKELVDSGKMTNIEFHDQIIKQNYLPIEMVRATLTHQKLSRDYQPNWKFYEFKK